MDLRRVVIEPAQGAQRHADLVLRPSAHFGRGRFSFSKVNVKLVITGSS
jgi:hypothetical protein